MSTKLKVGDTAPDFTLTGTDFKAVKLSDYKGKKVVLTTFPAAFSGGPSEGCEFHLCSLKPISEKASVIGVSSDLPFANAAFKEKLELPFPILSDPKGAVAETYTGMLGLGDFLVENGIASDTMKGVQTLPRALFVIDESGSIKYSWIGQEDGKLHPGKMPDFGEVKSHL
eukprot:CAMPEP_0198727426 /NCGR_PEP_ID=MMETSP1475-20131203/4159_1 /TAXON_ID= ORGANISM="Unidentified sp., Strain CCMP1999" /NCGR_SAMPLE_ID=MMETSP1475 /ASSEMBLY_ACC=CAM_ASM_001111 /LENGTH=169 /DNA_ID=CAMNT_0044489461 /DNA_START=121 /DNA_END=630 /DNA_ORIENTATION=+